MKKVSILDMAEDLIDEDLSSDIGNNQTSVSKGSGSKKSRLTKCTSLEGLIIDVAKIIDIPVKELHNWINEAAIPENILKTILTTAKRLKLNPVLSQIAWELNQEGDHEVFIPIDGWIALIHREPSFQGVVFNQSEETENGVPIWMECTIYCSDLTYPVTVREYYAEVKGDHPMWQEMPRRMLRYKTLQQCARLAFAISMPQLIIRSHSSTIDSTISLNKNRISITGRNYLKQKLNMNKV